MRMTQCFLLPAHCCGFACIRKDRHIKKVGISPNFLALSLDGNMAYVSSYETGELLEVDLKQHAVTRAVEVGSAPLGVALADGGKSVYVACRETGTVAVVNIRTFKVDSENQGRRIA